MSYEVYLAETFQRSTKILKNKFRRVKDDLSIIIKILEEDPTIGDPIPGWKKEIWKVRVASSDVKKGKRGGFRLIYLWRAGESAVYLSVVYFKGEEPEISKKKIERLLRQLNQELEQANPSL